MIKYIVYFVSLNDANISYSALLSYNVIRVYRLLPWSTVTINYFEKYCKKLIKHFIRVLLWNYIKADIHFSVFELFTNFPNHLASKRNNFSIKLQIILACYNKLLFSSICRRECPVVHLASKKSLVHQLGGLPRVIWYNFSRSRLQIRDVWQLS